MKERPILFNAEMVRAILEGRKTQTRRMVKNLPEGVKEIFFDDECNSWCYSKMENGLMDDPNAIMITPPYGTVGDRIWVREVFALKNSGFDDSPNVIYEADGSVDGVAWMSSRSMPRLLSRITLEITAVRVERLQEITEEDAMNEGCEREFKPDGSQWGAGLVEAKENFRDIWNSIHNNWDSNPFVWVYEFRRVKP